MGIVLIVLTAIMLAFTEEAVTSKHVEVKVFKSWIVTHGKGKSCSLGNSTRLKYTASLRSRKKDNNLGEPKTVEIHLMFVARFREFPVAINARRSLEKPEEIDIISAKHLFLLI